MKTKAIIILSALLAPVLLSCSKEQQTASPDGEIILTVGDSAEFSTDTKATAITSVPSSLYWGASTGTSGTSDATKWSSASATVSSGKINTGKYQTATATAYNYYLSNVSMTAATTGWTIAASNTTDVIAGVTKASSSTSPSVTLNHVFARTGSLSLSNSGGGSSSVSATAWKIVKKGTNTGTDGTYNIATDAWSSTSGLTTATAFTSSSDMYLIPGVYTVTVTYTKTLGDNVVTGCTASGDITLVAGKINNIAAKVSITDPVSIQISVSLTEWGSNTISQTFN